MIERDKIEALVPALASGDAAAFEEFYNHTKRSFRTHLAARLGDTNWEDTFHDLFAHVLVRFRSGEINDLTAFTVSTFRFGVLAKSEAIRKRERRELLTDLNDDEGEEGYAAHVRMAQPADQAETFVIAESRAAHWQLIRKAIRLLPTHLQRKVARRVWLHGECDGAVEAGLKITAHSLRCAKWRAQQALAAAVPGVKVQLSRPIPTSCKVCGKHETPLRNRRCNACNCRWRKYGYDRPSSSRPGRGDNSLVECACGCGLTFWQYDSTYHLHKFAKGHGPQVLCACGCGTKIPQFDVRGRERQFVERHGRRKPTGLAAEPGATGSVVRPPDEATGRQAGQSGSR